MEEEKTTREERDGSILPERREAGDFPTEAENTPRWLTFSSEEKRVSRRGERSLRGILFAVFATAILCLGLAIWSLANRATVPPVEETQTEEASSAEKVIFVREYDTEGSRLTLPEIYGQCAPSSVAISCKGEGTWSSSGFVLRSDGYVATALEAVEGAESIGVRLCDGREYPATLLASDALCGLALLRIEAEGLPSVQLSEQETVLAGERVLGIGTAGDSDFSGSAISLRISYPLREVFVREEPSGRLLKKQNLIQLDTLLGQGWTGAPLFDEYGGFLGMIHASGGGDMSFALPGAGVLEILSLLIEGKSPSPEAQAVLAKPASRLGILGERGAEDGMYGVRIRGFSEGPVSAADMLKEGDLILRIDGTPVTRWEEIAILLETKQVGETVEVSVLRNGQVLTFPVILTD